jgi:DNA-binding CsgD family transcriptional regulator
LSLKNLSPIESSDEIGELKACLNDLMGILALPTIWTGRTPDQIISALLDAVRRVLELDFAYAQFYNSDGSRSQTFRMANRSDSTIDHGGLLRALERWLRNDPERRSPFLHCPGVVGKFRLAAFSLGANDRRSVLIAASARCGFPTKSERLLLSVAANEAAVGLREAHLLNVQRKAEEANKSDMADLKMKYARLTPREREVLPFVVAGRLSKQTAAELGTSEITIRVHRGQIMRKMQAPSLAELIRIADALGVRRLSGSSKLRHDEITRV